MTHEKKLQKTGFEVRRAEMKLPTFKTLSIDIEYITTCTKRNVSSLASKLSKLFACLPFAQDTRVAPLVASQPSPPK